MTKQEKIKEAWAVCSIPKTLEQLTGCYWFRCKRSQVEHLKDEFDFITWDLKECSIRPKALQGIENNNGWIKIESEDDLPKLTIEYYVLKNGSLTTAYYRGNNRWVIPENDFPKTTEIHKITHYQPIEKPKPPIY